MSFMTDGTVRSSSANNFKRSGWLIPRNGHLDLVNPLDVLHLRDKVTAQSIPRALHQVCVTSLW